MKFNKIKNLTSVLAIIGSFLFIACNGNDDVDYNDVVGIYKGTLTNNLGNKSESPTVFSDATVVVEMIGDLIEVNCFNDNFNTTIMLDVFEDGNNVMTCLTGDTFESMYGHMLGQGNMSGNMNSNGSEWMQHLNNEHEKGDEHFGSFNTTNHSFEYKFILEDGEYYFQGTKE